MTKPLSADMAHDIYAIIEAHPNEPTVRPRSRGIDCRDALNALKASDHVAIERVTEAEAREAFEAIEDKDRPSYMLRSVFYLDKYRKERWLGWLAAYRALGVIKGE